MRRISDAVPMPCVGDGLPIYFAAARRNETAVSRAVWISCEEITMTKWVRGILIAGMFAVPLIAGAQQSSSNQEAASRRNKDGKKLFGTAEALRVARVSSPRISPDGARVAYLVAENVMDKEKDTAWKSVTQLWMVPTAGPAAAARQFTRGEKSVSNLEWSPDGKLLAFTMDAGDEKDAKPQVWFMYADGGEPWQVTKHKSGVRGFQFSPDAKTLLLTATVPLSDDEEKRTKQKDDAVVVDHDFKMGQLWTWSIATNEEKQLTKGDFTASDARWSPDGARVTFTTNPTPRLDDIALQTAWVVDVASGKQRKLVETADPTSMARWSPDGKSIAYLSSAGLVVYKVNLFVVDANGGAAKKMSGSFELNAGEPVWSRDGKTIFFSSDDHEAMKIFAADVAAGTVRALTDAATLVNLAEISANGKMAVGTWGDATHPDDVFHSDLSFGSLERITNQNAWLSEYALGASEVVRWKSSKDGMEIEGIVTKPVDFDGSTGRGEKFEAANQNDWGIGDFKDDMSGVQAMVDKGWADPDRLGAFGWSYGGYMTMWIDTQTDRFKAISPGAGLPDLYSMYSETDIHRYLTVFFNAKAPWDNY